MFRNVAEPGRAGRGTIVQNGARDDRARDGSEANDARGGHRPDGAQSRCDGASGRPGLSGVKSHSGLTGGDAVKVQQYIAAGKALSGGTLLDAVSKAMATNEVNAAMGLICATPTAGAAGVVPGTLFALKEKLNPTREQMVEFLFTAGAFGLVVANNASISGAAGGCQAEVGSAAGMAAAAIAELAGARRGRRRTRWRSR